MDSRRLLRAMLVLVATAAVPTAAFCSDTTSYALRSWTARDGLPGHNVRAFAQDRRGYLWVGTDAGLARFDGVRFIAWDLGERSEAVRLGVRALCATVDGSLWVAYTAVARVDRIQDDKVTAFWPSDGLISGSVRIVFQDRHGQLWVGGRGGLSAFRDGRWQRVTVGTELEQSTVTTLFEDKAGDLWVESSVGLFRREGRTDTFTKVEALTSLAQGFVTDIEGRVLVLDQHLKWHNVASPESTSPSLRIADPSLVGLPARVLADRDGYWWITFRGKGLVRVHASAPHASEVFGIGNGLAGSQVTALFQDREGTIWAGTDDGVVQLSPGAIRNLSPSVQLPVPQVLTSDQNGNVWIGTHAGLVRSFNGEMTAYGSREGLPNAAISAIHADQRGAIWIATAEGLTRYWHGMFRRVPLPVDLRAISALITDNNGRLWIADNEKGLYWWDEPRLIHVPNPAGLWYEQVSSFHVDKRGRVWAGLFSGSLIVYDGHQFSYPYGEDGRLRGAVVSIIEDAPDVFLIVTTSGLNWIRDGVPMSHAQEDSFPVNRLTAAIESANGDLWLAGEDRILKIERKDRQDLRDNPSSLRYQIYDDSDGLLGNVALFAVGFPKAAVDRAGSPWFITTSGVAVVKPSSPTIQYELPNVSIDALLVDGRALKPTSTSLLPTAVSRLQLDYNVVSLRAPKKLRFQHMLEGLENHWVDNGSNRRASYSALSPGHYRFHVRAHIDGTEWPSTGTVWEFDVPPAYYQTYWFGVACVGMLGIVGWGVWRFRVQQIHARFALVMAERSRVAREIHDTLLQNLVALGLHLDNVSEGIALGFSPDTLRSRLESLRRQVEDSVADARLSVWNLRRPNQSEQNVCEAVRQLGDRITANSDARFVFSARGAVSRMPAFVEEQMLRIVQEAMNNAVRHSKASTVHLNVGFTAQSLTVSIADDGCGFDTGQLTRAPGHWGIAFMHERAQQIGGCVSITSDPGRGTTVECTVPLSVVD